MFNLDVDLFDEPLDADPPAPLGSCSFVHRRIIKAAVGFATGGPTGAISGFITGGGGGQKKTRALPLVAAIDTSRPHTHPATSIRGPLVHPAHGTPASSLVPQGSACVFPTKRDPITGKCRMYLGDVPGRDPGEGMTRGGEPVNVLAEGGDPIMGGFGLPAMTPQVVGRVVRLCGPGMVLGRDELCYPKSVLQRRSSLRKWRLPARPVFSAADSKTINKADALRNKVKDLNKKVGLRVPTKRTATK